MFSKILSYSQERQEFPVLGRLHVSKINLTLTIHLVEGETSKSSSCLALDLTFYRVLKKIFLNLFFQRKFIIIYNSWEATKNHNSLQKLPCFCFPHFIKLNSPGSTSFTYGHKDEGAAQIRTQAAWVRSGALSRLLVLTKGSRSQTKCPWGTRQTNNRDRKWMDGN